MPLTLRLKTSHHHWPSKRLQQLNSLGHRKKLLNNHPLTDIIYYIVGKIREAVCSSASSIQIFMIIMPEYHYWLNDLEQLLNSSESFSCEQRLVFHVKFAPQGWHSSHISATFLLKVSKLEKLNYLFNLWPLCQDITGWCFWCSSYVAKYTIKAGISF